MPEGDETDRAPLDDLAERLRRRRETERAPDAGDPFEEIEVPTVDPEAVWDAIESDADATDGAVADRVVSKSSYCQRCPHFADPPEMACTHEGTAIVELVDSEHVRVRNCPMGDDGDAPAAVGLSGRSE